MEELEFSRELLKILDEDTLKKTLKKASTQGFTVQGFKNIYFAPLTIISSAMEKKKRGGKFQYKIFLECLAELETDNEAIHLAKDWLENEEQRIGVQERLIHIKTNTNKKKKSEDKKRTEVIDSLEEKSNLEDKKNNEDLEFILNQKEKIKKYQKTIQEYKILIDNYTKENEGLKKENKKLIKQSTKNQENLDELVECNNKLTEQIQYYSKKLEENQEELNYYKKILEYVPRVICFSKKKIDDKFFPLKKIEQLECCEDKFLYKIDWKKYSEIWIIESDFSFSEVLKIRNATKKKIICARNLKSLIEKVGGISNGYAR